MTKGTGNRNANTVGRHAVLTKDIELKNWVLSEYMSGKPISQIAKDIIVKFPEKPPLSRVSLSRFINQHLTEIDVDEAKEFTATQELLRQFDETKNNFNELFDKLRNEVPLSPEQLTMVDTMQRKCNISLNQCKNKWKLYIVACKQNTFELKTLLADFTNTLNSSQKETLSQMVDDMFEPDEMITEEDKAKYQRFLQKKIKMYYSMFPQNDSTGVEVQ